MRVASQSVVVAPPEFGNEYYQTDSLPSSLIMNWPARPPLFMAFPLLCWG